MIAAAKRFIYFENQYFTCGKIAAAIAERLNEDEPPEFVMVMPETADGWLEQMAMDAARVQLVRAIAKSKNGNRLRVYYPRTKGGESIYVHAKTAIVDDRMIRVGSANMNNRSMGLDSECDVTIDTALPANHGVGAAIRRLRESLIAEHLDVEPAEVARRFETTGSLIDTIEGLRNGGRSLEWLDLVPPGPMDEFIAENELLDPAGMPDPFGTVLRDYLDTLERYRLLTYGQQIARSVHELERPEVAAAVHTQLRHLIVDEYQDVNPAQERLVELLTGPDVERLERVFRSLGAKPKRGSSAAVTAIISDGERLLARNVARDVRDAWLIATAQQIEHLEIATYGTIRTYAETLGYTFAAQLLQQTLEEERATDEKLTHLAERFVNPQSIRASHPH